MNKKEMAALAKKMRKEGATLDKIALAIHKRRSVVKELLGSAACAKCEKKPAAVKKPAAPKKPAQTKNCQCKEGGIVVSCVAIKVTKADAKKMRDLKAAKAAKDKPETKGKAKQKPCAKPAKKPAAPKKPVKK